MEGTLRVRVPALAAAAGFVDAVSFIVLFALFTAHLTGDTTHLAVDLGRESFGGRVAARVVVIAIFVVAVALGTFGLAAASRLHRARRMLLLAEAGLLMIFMLAGSYWLDRGDLTEGAVATLVLAACAAAAMGLQNVVVRNAVGTQVSTTFLTGMLTAFAEDLAAAIRHRHDGGARRRARLHLSMWVSFLAGGVLGAAAVTEWDLWALLVPIVAIVAVAATEPAPAAGARRA